MAAPSPSSSCEIVDLTVAAILSDDATSHLFFSGGGGDDDLSWPEAAAIESTLTSNESVALCHKFGVPKELKPVRAATGCRAACDTPPTEGQLCVYSDALEAGLRFPMPAFYRKVLRHYGLAPTQLVPNAWAYMAAFVQRCKDAGVEPKVSAFRYFFSLRALKRKDMPLGWHYFHHTNVTGRHHLFSGTLQTKSGWKSRFFFLQSPEEKGMQWGCPVAWGKPRREDVGAVKLTADDAAVEKLKSLPCVDLKSLLRRHTLDLNLLQLHSMPKLECAAAASARAPSLTSLYFDPTPTLALGTAAELGSIASGSGSALPKGEAMAPLESLAPPPVPQQQEAAGRSSVSSQAPVQMPRPTSSRAAGRSSEPTPKRPRTPRAVVQRTSALGPRALAWRTSDSSPAGVVTSSGPMPAASRGGQPATLPPVVPVTAPEAPVTAAAPTATLEAGASTADDGEGDDSTRRKRMCPAAVTPPQSFTISAAPPSLQGMEITPHTLSFDGACGSSSEISLPAGIPPLQEIGMTPCETLFDGAWGSSSSETFLPPGIRSSDDYVAAIEAEKERLLQANQQAVQDIAYLQYQLQQAVDRERDEKAMNEKFMDYLVEARAKNAQLEGKYTSEIAKLNQEHASEVAKLKDEHHKASTAHAEKAKAERTAEIAKLQEKHADEVAKLNQEHASKVAKLKDEHHKASTAHAEKAKAERTAEIAKLQEKHADEVAKLNQAHQADLARMKHAMQEAAVNLVQDVKKDIALSLFPDLDASLL